MMQKEYLMQKGHKKTHSVKQNWTDNNVLKKEN